MNGRGIGAWRAWRGWLPTLSLNLLWRVGASGGIRAYRVSALPFWHQLSTLAARRSLNVGQLSRASGCTMTFWNQHYCLLLSLLLWYVVEMVRGYRWALARVCVNRACLGEGGKGGVWTVRDVW